MRGGLAVFGAGKAVGIQHPRARRVVGLVKQAGQHFALATYKFNAQCWHASPIGSDCLINHTAWKKSGCGCARYRIQASTNHTIIKKPMASLARVPTRMPMLAPTPARMESSILARAAR